MAHTEAHGDVEIAPLLVQYLPLSDGIAHGFIAPRSYLLLILYADPLLGDSAHLATDGYNLKSPVLQNRDQSLGLVSHPNAEGHPQFPIAHFLGEIYDLFHTGCHC